MPSKKLGLIFLLFLLIGLLCLSSTVNSAPIDGMENANGPEIAVESTAAMAEADDKSKM
jgi:hypothetical protein